MRATSITASSWDSTEPPIYHFGRGSGGPARRYGAYVPDLAIEMDVVLQPSIDAAIDRVIAENSRIDVIVHRAGHMVFSPSEALTAERFARL